MANEKPPQTPPPPPPVRLVRGNVAPGNQPVRPPAKPVVPPRGKK